MQNRVVVCKARAESYGVEYRFYAYLAPDIMKLN